MRFVEVAYIHDHVLMRDLQVSLALSGPSVAEGPKDYKLVVSTVQQPIYIIAEDDQGRFQSLALGGI